MTATKIQPGDDTHLTSLMAPHSLNFVTGADRAALLAYGRDVFAAGLAGAAPAAVAQRGEYPPLPEGVMFIEQIGGDVIARPTEYAYFKNARGVVHGAQLFTADQLRAYFDLGRQPATVEEPAQPVAEICSASHDDAEFGERAIKPLCDISSFEYGTPLYAGAAPAAVAPQGVTAWMHPETLDVISDAKKHEMSTQYGTETRRKAEGYSVAMAPVEQSAAAPALEAPAAVPGWKLVPEQPTQEMCESAKYGIDARLSVFKWADGYKAMLAAAPQAPAAPSIPQWIDDPHDIEQGQMLNPAWVQAQAAPAAPAVDAQPLIARSIAEWHEDDGDVSWWAWCGHGWAGEPAWIGRPTDDGWPGYHTHWTAHPAMPPAIAAQAAAKGEHDE